MDRIIGHLDMDAFFAAVEERDHPRFKGRPIVVGADPEDGHGRGVVSTANYKAREYGIHSAQPISVAWRLAKKAEAEGKMATIFVGGHPRSYQEASKNFMTIIRKHVPIAEEAGIDEAYLDLSFTESYESAAHAGAAIKAEIKKRERLTCTIGIGPNKMIAKMASGHKKPDGLTLIRPEQVRDFLDPQPAISIPGIGPKSAGVLEKFGIKTILNLRQMPKEKLTELFGKWGGEMFERAHGIDNSPITEFYEVKSIGEQETFHNDTLDINFIVERLERLCRSVFRRFQESGFKSYRTTAITVRFADFQTQSRAYTLGKPKDDLKTLRIEAMGLLMPFFDKRENPRRKLIRLIGVRIEKLGKAL